MMNQTRKVLFIHFEETSNPSKLGILNKLDGIFKAFQQKGLDLDIISFKTKKTLQFNYTTFLKLPSRILWFRYFVFKAILRKTSSHQYDFVYIRYFKSDRYFLNFLRKIKKRGIKVFIEFPTFPYDQELIPNNLIERLIISHDRNYREKIFPFVFRAITFFNDEEIFNIPTIKLQNGIDIEKYLELTLPEFNNEELNLIAVANISKWHGYDRLIKGLRNYYSEEGQKKKITLKIVGTGNAITELKHLVHELKLETSVSFVGPKTGVELNSEFNNMNLGVGSLGMHRIGLNTGSILKLREYAARGLASVIAYHDYSIEKNNPFVLQVNADETPINIQSLIDFIQNLQVTPHEIREYAIKNFSWAKQLDKILNELEQ